MSNKITDANILDFLANTNFVKLLAEKNLPIQIHNLLLGLHVVVMGVNTTGITEGGTTLNYLRRLSPIEEDFVRPKNDFFFYTTKNQMIEDSNYCSSSRLSFKNELFHFKYTRDFRDFCINYYDKYSKTIPENEFLENEFSKITFRFRLSKLNKQKRNNTETKESVYNQLFQEQPKIKSVIEALHLEYILNNDKKNKVKFKI